jgi:anti-sigma-K factor RskA
MNEETRDLAAGEALGILSNEDAVRLAEAAAHDPELAKELEADRATVAALEAGVARTRPPADLFERILGEIEPASVEEEPTPMDARPRRLGWVVAAGAAAAAAVLLAVAANVLWDGGLGEPDARAVVAGTQEFPGVTGEARLYAPGEPGGVLVLDLDALPAPPSGHHYEVWVLREGGEGEMEAVGSFTPTEERAELELQLPGPGDFQAVDVSVEPDGGSAEHSGVSLAGGVFEA